MKAFARTPYGRPTGSAISKLTAFVELLHIPPIIAVLSATIAFAIVASDGWPKAAQLWPLLAALLLTQLAISIHNDYCDRELDATAKPWRALPRGLMSPDAALMATAVLTFTGVALSYPLGVRVTGLIALGASCGLVYNAWLKRSAWSWLPFWIALPTLPLVAFASVDRFETRLWLAYVIGAPLVVAVYLADTVIDIETDRTQGVRGLAHALTPAQARIVCWLCVAVGQVLALLTWPGGSPNVLFFVSVALLCLSPFATVPVLKSLHWPAVMASIIALATGWLAAV